MLAQDSLAPGSLELIARHRTDLTLEAAVLASSELFNDIAVQNASAKLGRYSPGWEAVASTTTSAVDLIISGLRILTFCFEEQPNAEEHLKFGSEVGRAMSATDEWTFSLVDTSLERACAFACTAREVCELQSEPIKIPFVTQEELDFGGFLFNLEDYGVEIVDPWPEINYEWIVARILEQVDKLIPGAGTPPETREGTRTNEMQRGLEPSVIHQLRVLLANPVHEQSREDAIEKGLMQTIGRDLYTALVPAARVSLLQSERLLCERDLPDPGVGIVLPIAMAFERQLAVILHDLGKFLADHGVVNFPDDRLKLVEAKQVKQLDSLGAMKHVLWRKSDQAQEFWREHRLNPFNIRKQIDRILPLRNASAHEPRFSREYARQIRNDWLGTMSQPCIFACFLAAGTAEARRP